MKRYLKLSSRQGYTTSDYDSRSTYINVMDISAKLDPKLPNKMTRLGIDLEAICTEKNVKQFVDQMAANKHPDFHRREFLVAGKSNVGKSSLINTFLGDKVARVSNEPVLLIFDFREKLGRCSSTS